MFAGHAASELPFEHVPLLLTSWLPTAVGGCTSRKKNMASSSPPRTHLGGSQPGPGAGRGWQMLAGATEMKFLEILAAFWSCWYSNVIIKPPEMLMLGMVGTNNTHF